MQVKSNAGAAQVQSQSPNQPVMKTNSSPNRDWHDSLDAIAIRTGKQLHLAEVKGADISIGEEQLIKAIERAVKVLAGPTTTVEMQIHKKTDQVVMKVVNKATGDVIREVPPEKMLDLVAKMMEFAGILIDERV